MDGAFCLEDDILYIFAYGIDPDCLYLYECDEDSGSCTLIYHNEEIDLVSPYLFVIPWNYPPNPPKIDGPISGKPNTEYDFSFNALNNLIPFSPRSYHPLFTSIRKISAALFGWL